MRKQNKITVKFQTFLSAVFFKHFRKNKLKFWSNTQAFISYTLFTCCKTAPTPAIHFLLGELPMEGKVHSDMFSLFFSVWSNPDSKIYEILKYLLFTSPDNSRTWAINLKHIMYGMEDPLSCQMRDPPSKSEYKEIVFTHILAFREKELRILAASNSKMKYLC